MIPNQSYRPKNGMQVILHEDHRTPFIAVQVTYHYGPLYEPASSRGVAHLLEHLLQGHTVHLPSSTPSSQLQRIGAVQIRLRLEPDRLDSWAVVPSANLARALWAESDRMGFMLPEVRNEDIAYNKKVIALEDRLRMSTVPYAAGDEQLSAALIPLGQPIYGNWRGIVPAVNKTSELEPTLSRFYSPSNATLVLAGDFTREDAVRLVEKYFGTLNALPPPVLPQPELGAIEREVVLRQQDSVARRPRIRLGWLMPALKHQASAVAALLELLLDRGATGRLQEELGRLLGAPAQLGALRAADGLVRESLSAGRVATSSGPGLVAALAQALAGALTGAASAPQASSSPSSSSSSSPSSSLLSPSGSPGAAHPSSGRKEPT